MKIKASYTRAVNKSTVNLHFCDIYLNEQSGFLHDFLHNPLTDNINRKNVQNGKVKLWSKDELYAVINLQIINSRYQ